MIKTKKNVSGGFRSKNLFKLAKEVLDGETVEFATT